MSFSQNEILGRCHFFQPRGALGAIHRAAEGGCGGSDLRVREPTFWVRAGSIFSSGDGGPSCPFPRGGGGWLGGGSSSCAGLSCPCRPEGLWLTRAPGTQSGALSCAVEGRLAGARPRTAGSRQSPPSSSVTQTLFQGHRGAARHCLCNVGSTSL